MKTVQTPIFYPTGILALDCGSCASMCDEMFRIREQFAVSAKKNLLDSASVGLSALESAGIA